MQFYSPSSRNIKDQCIILGKKNVYNNFQSKGKEFSHLFFFLRVGLKIKFFHVISMSKEERSLFE